MKKPASQKVAYGKATLLGLGFGLLGAVIWAIVTVASGWQFGAVAIVVGWLVGYGVHVGAGKNMNANFQWLAAGLALVAVIAGQYFITNHYVYEYLASEGESYFYLLPFVPVLQSTFDMLLEDPLTILFFLIAIYAAWAAPAKMAQKKIEEEVHKHKKS